MYSYIVFGSFNHFITWPKNFLHQHVCVIVHACICNEHDCILALPKIMQYTNTTNISWRVILYLSYMHCPLPQPTNTVFFGPTKLYPPPQLTIWLWLISNLLEYLIYSSSSWYPFCYYQLINYRKYKEGCYCDYTNIHVHT